MNNVFAALVLSLVATSAFAEERREVKLLDSLRFDGKTLEVGYMWGGGCQPHTTDVKVDIVTSDADIYPLSGKVVVSVFDVTPEEDFCEAILHGHAKVDLAAMVREAAAAQGLTERDLQTLRLELPRVTVRAFDFE